MRPPDPAMELASILIGASSIAEQGNCAARTLFKLHTIAAWLNVVNYAEHWVLCVRITFTLITLYCLCPHMPLWVLRRFANAPVLCILVRNPKLHVAAHPEQTAYVSPTIPCVAICACVSADPTCVNRPTTTTNRQADFQKNV